MSRQGRLSRYLVAILAVIGGVGLRWILDPWLGQHVPFATLYGTVAIAVWWGGVAPAVWAAALGYVAADYLFVKPHGGLGQGVSQLVTLAAYLT
jgi:K+-sensing histidine kinase KdpD